MRQLTDASASVSDTYDYDAFGILIHRTGTTSNDYLYSGEQFDANLGFYYLRARYMDSATGRFISADSFEGGISDPVSLHKYLYANSNPVGYLDPTGNSSLANVLVTSSIIGALSGGFLREAIGTIDAQGDNVAIILTRGQFSDAELGTLGPRIFGASSSKRSIQVVYDTGNGYEMGPSWKR